MIASPVNHLFDYFLNESFIFYVHKMSENAKKCQSVPPKAQDTIFKCPPLFMTQRHSAHCHRGPKKPVNTHIQDAGIREFRP